MPRAPQASQRQYRLPPNTPNAAGPGARQTGHRAGSGMGMARLNGAATRDQAGRGMDSRARIA